jgi:hypothetical protein
MHDDMSIDDAFFYYFYLEDMQRHDVDDVEYHLPDYQTLQQFRERMKQNRDERYYA